MLNIDTDTVIVFDLDDTLYKEIDFLYSAYNHIAMLVSMDYKISKMEVYNMMIDTYKAGGNPFGKIIQSFKLSKYTTQDFVNIYRTHVPNISLEEDTLDFLKRLKKNNIKTALITDGRSITQRNKIKALGLENYFDTLVISEEFGSEKPNIKNYQAIIQMFPNKKYVYIGDNPRKDFISPNMMDWVTIGLTNKGNNVHPQHWSLYKSEELPMIYIDSMSVLLKYLS